MAMPERLTSTNAESTLTLPMLKLRSNTTLLTVPPEDGPITRSNLIVPPRPPRDSLTHRISGFPILLIPIVAALTWRSIFCGNSLLNASAVYVSPSISWSTVSATTRTFFATNG